MEENRNEVVEKITKLVEKLKQGLSKLFNHIADKLKSWSQRLDPKHTPTEAVEQSSSAEEVKASNPTKQAGKLASVVVRHIEIDYDVINKDVTRSQDFKENLTRAIEKSL